MSDVTSHYVVRVKHVGEAQYASLRSTLVMTIQRQSWKVGQVSFITGARSLNEEELKKNLTFFEVPSGSIEPIRVKLAMKIFDEYANILKGMHSIRYDGRSDHGGTSTHPVHGRSNHGDAQPEKFGSPRLLLSTLSQSGSLTKLGNTRRERKRERNN